MVKPSTLSTIEEQTPLPTPKQSLSSILLKHKNNLGLNAVHSVLMEKEKLEQKEQEHQRKKAEINSLGLFKSAPQGNKTNIPNSKESKQSSPRKKEKNPEVAKRYAETTKNVRKLSLL